MDQHSSNATNNPELCYPANLYEPIWLLDIGQMGKYVYQTVNN